MKGAFWFAAGAGASIYAMLRARRAAEILTPEGLRDRWEALGVGARVLREEMSHGRAEAEADLRERLLPARDTPPQLNPAPPGDPRGANIRMRARLEAAEDGHSTGSGLEGSR